MFRRNILSVSPKRWHLPTSLHCAKTQKNSITTNGVLHKIVLSKCHRSPNKIRGMQTLGFFYNGTFHLRMMPVSYVGTEGRVL
jgi:hypothetical protein